MDVSAPGRVFRGIVKKADLFKHGHADPAQVNTPEQIARFYNLELNRPFKGRMVLSSPDQVIVGYDQKTLKPIKENPRASISFMEPEEFIEDHWKMYNIDDPKHGLRPHNPGVLGALNALKPSKVSNIDMTTALGKAGPLYRALYDINKEEGAVNVVDYLTPPNRDRRGVHIFSDAMHHPDDFNQFIMLADQQGVGAHPLAQIFDQPESALGRLAMSDYYKANKSTGRELGQSSRGIFQLDKPTDDIMAYAKDIGDRFGGKGGIGEMTARRALVTNQINRMLDSGVPENEVIQSIMETSHPMYKGLFYKRGGLATASRCYA